MQFTVQFLRTLSDDTEDISQSLNGLNTNIITSSPLLLPVVMRATSFTASSWALATSRSSTWPCSTCRTQPAVTLATVLSHLRVVHGPNHGRWRWNASHFPVAAYCACICENAVRSESFFLPIYTSTCPIPSCNYIQYHFFATDSFPVGRQPSLCFCGAFECHEPETSEARKGRNLKHR